MKVEDIRKWMEDSIEARPYNHIDIKDGNHHYIHRTKVAELIARLRKEGIEEEPKDSVSVTFFKPEKMQYCSRDDCPPQKRGECCHGDCFDCYHHDSDKYERYLKKANGGE